MTPQVTLCNIVLTTFDRVHETGDGKLAIDRDHYLANVRLTMHEVMAVHLAARLMATRTDKHNPHAASALPSASVMMGELEKAH